MKYTQYMRDAAALCGVPVSVWAYRALHSAAFEVHTTCHKALEEAGLRNANEIAERKHAQWQAEQLREVNRRMEIENANQKLIAEWAELPDYDPTATQTSKHDCTKCGVRVYGGALQCDDCIAEDGQ